MQSTAESRSAVQTALPEVREIADDKLRGAVIGIWAHAVDASGWDAVTSCPKGVELPAQHTLVTHSRNVATISITMAEVMSRNNKVTIDRDSVIAIALLHDVSKFLEFEPGPSGQRWSEIGRKYQHGFLGAMWMRDAGLSVDLVHAVIAHTPKSNVVPQTQEALIVHYADFADTDSLLLANGLTPYCKRR